MKTFLFLQGGSSFFFPRLADRLRAEGHAVHRVNFCGGDYAFWGRRPAVNFPGALDELPGWLEERIEAWGISDIVLYGDRRPVHRPAIEIGKRRGLRVHVFEEGYFRPHLVTLERGGVTGSSPLPRDPGWYRAVGPAIPEQSYGKPFSATLFDRALHDIRFEVANLVNRPRFPRYRTHVPYNRWVGYASHARRFALMPFRALHDRRLLDRLNREDSRVFLLPLQLESDAQIRYYSPHKTMTEVIERVIRSFAQHAPGDALLAIKNHPLDPGFVNYAPVIERLARETGTEGRVHYVDTGDASAITRRARGIVTVNSTVGMSALALERPVMVLGTAIYDMPGLTFQGSLDEFWREPAPPDPELFRLYRNTVIHTTQVNGGFYTKESTAMAVRNCLRLLLAERSPLEELLQRQ